MGLETGSFIADLVLTNPAATDLVSEGDDHVRLIKTVVQNTFPGMGGVFNRVDARSTGYTVLTTDNTKHFVIDNSSTATVTLSLPAVASITSGFSLMITTRAGASVLLDGNASEQINGATTFAVPDRNCAHIFYTGTAWQANLYPTADGSLYVFHHPSIFSGTAVFNHAVQLNGTVTVASGQLAFPAAQNASSGANVLDDYEEGTWTPTLRFDTMGDLNVAYSFNTGTYTKVGRQVTAHCSLAATTFTHSTAAGSFRIAGAPFTKSGAHDFAAAIWLITGIDMLNPDQITIGMDGSVNGEFLVRWNNTSNGASSGVTPAEVPSGNTVIIYFTCTYHV